MDQMPVLLQLVIILVAIILFDKLTAIRSSYLKWAQKNYITKVVAAVIFVTLLLFIRLRDLNSICFFSLMCMHAYLWWPQKEKNI